MRESADDAGRHSRAARTDWEALAGPGDWWTGAERVAAAAEVRAAEACQLCLDRREALTPAAVEGEHRAVTGAVLPPVAIDVVHRVSSDAGRLTRRWCEAAVAELGDAPYAELVGVTAVVKALDAYSVAMGRPPTPLPGTRPGEPARERPDGMGDVGAWIPQATEKVLANVSRSISLVPRTNTTWRDLVNAHYTRGREFFDLRWDDRPLRRPQVEVVAARVAELNRCHY